MTDDVEGENPNAGQPQQLFNIEELLIVRPSPWLRMPTAKRGTDEHDRQSEIQHRITSMVDLAEKFYGEAVGIFIYFNQLRSQTSSPPDFSAESEERRRASEHAANLVAEEMGLDSTKIEDLIASGRYDEFTSRVRLKAHFPILLTPNNYRLPMQMKTVLARSFVSSVDSFGRAVQKLAKEAGLDEKTLTASLDAEIPHLRGVRNTAHHPEDRAHFEGPGGKPINPGPIEMDPFIVAPNGGPMVQDSLFNDIYVATMANGDVGQVLVGPPTLLAMRETLAAVYDNLEFEESLGGGVIVPL